MLPSPNRNLINIKTAMDNLVMEDSNGLRKKLKDVLLKFIKDNSKDFKNSKAIKEGKVIAMQILNTTDDINVINLIADFSNLLKDSSVHADKLEEFMALV
jgi:hypothetical protein